MKEHLNATQKHSETSPYPPLILDFPLMSVSVSVGICFFGILSKGSKTFVGQGALPLPKTKIT